MSEDTSLAKVRLIKTANNAVPISNAIELITSVVSKASSKEAAMCSKTNLTRSVLTNLVGSRLKKKLVEISKC